MPDYIEATFKPQRDISAWELAVILSKVRWLSANESVRFTPAQWVDLDPTIKRHFD